MVTFEIDTQELQQKIINKENRLIFSDAMGKLYEIIEYNEPKDETAGLP